MDRDEMAAIARDGWGAVADSYVEHLFDELDHKPFDRERLDAFAASIPCGAQAIDIGCGPGHIGLYLRKRGVDIVGLDLSPSMIDEAQKIQPEAEFVVGNVLKLDMADSAFGGALAMYSLINLVRQDLPLAMAEIFRVLRPGAPFLMAVHRGQDQLVADELFGRPLRMVVTLFAPDEVREAAESAGFVVDLLEVRGPYETEYKHDRIYLRAHRPPGISL